MATDSIYIFTFLGEGKVAIEEDGFSRGPFEVPLSGAVLHTVLALSWYVENTDELQCDSELLLVLGRHLFQLLFNDGPGGEQYEVRTRFVDRCSTQKVRIYLHFLPAARAYAQLPWEFLAVPGGSADSDVVRHIGDLPQPVTLTRFTPAQQELQRAASLSVLVATYSDRHRPEITSDALLAGLEKLKDLAGGRLRLEVLQNDQASPPEIKSALNRIKPDIFHFNGHGLRDALFFSQQAAPADLRIASTRKPLGFGASSGITTDEFEREFRASIRGVVDLFEDHAPKLVILDACSSDWSWLSEMLPGIAHQLVEVVPAVIAMRYPIANRSSEAFATTLYEEIAKGVPLDEAVRTARARIYPKGDSRDDHSIRAFGTPVLYLRRSERVCDSLSESSQVRPRLNPACPRCEVANLWDPDATVCLNCDIVFRCTNSSCKAAVAPGYSKEEIVRLAGKKCPYCGEDYSHIPQWVDGKPVEPPRADHPLASGNTFGGLHAV